MRASLLALAKSIYNYLHECLILTWLCRTIHVLGVVTLIFFLIVHQACLTRHFVWNPIGACDVAITSIRISVIAIGFSITKIIIMMILSNMFTCIRKYQFIKRMKMYSQTPLTPRAVGGPVQSNPVNTDTEGATESVRIKRLELRENARTLFLSPGTKQTICIIMRCPY